MGYSPRSHRQSDTTEQLSTGGRVGASGNLTDCLKGISGCSKIVLFSPNFISLFPSISLFCLKFSTPLCSLFGDLALVSFPSLHTAAMWKVTLLAPPCPGLVWNVPSQGPEWGGPFVSHPDWAKSLQPEQVQAWALGPGRWGWGGWMLATGLGNGYPGDLHKSLFTRMCVSVPSLWCTKMLVLRHY